MVTALQANQGRDGLGPPAGRAGSVVGEVAVELFALFFFGRVVLKGNTPVLPKFGLTAKDADW